MKRPNGDNNSKVEGCKRDFWYSFLSLIGFPFVFYSYSSVSTLDDLIQHIIQEHEIPIQILIFLTSSEVVKLFLTFTLFPSSHLLDPLASATHSKLYSSKLPLSSRRDREFSNAKSGGCYAKVVEFWKGFWNFVLICALCHLLMVLFGAPVMEDFILTLQFSIVLINWIFFPLCLALRPSFVLSEIAYISIWNTQIDSVFRAKWRFLICAAGTMIGAAFIPLDWDRPWQKWPITCLVSSAVSYLAVNGLLTIYLFSTVYCFNFKIPFFTRSSSKMKYF